MAIILYLAWFLALVRIMFLATGNSSTNTAEILGSHLGLAFWLTILSLVPYFIARSRAKKNGANISWTFVMVGATLIALVLSVGGFYGRSQTINSKASPPATVQNVQAQQPQAAPQPTVEPQIQEPLQVATPQPVALQFQCNGTYTQRDSGVPQQFSMTGVVVEITDNDISISGAAAFNGTHAIVNKQASGYGFRNSQDETIEGFFNRFSGELSLIDRLGPKNADGSFQVSANSVLHCQNANPMF